MRFRNAFIHEILSEFLQPFRYFGRRRGYQVHARDPHLYWVLNFWLCLETGFLRSRSSALSLSLDTGIGVESVLSCGNDVGVSDELEEEEAVDRPGTTIGT